LAYEEAFVDFAEAILVPAQDNQFLAEFAPFATKIAHGGMFNSLAQTLLKIVAPGVPDIYQGTELWDLSFVDPDNRRGVDFADRRRLLDELKLAESQDRIALMRDLLSNWRGGRVKLYLIHKLLSFRRGHPEFFTDADYIPLQAMGPMGERICAFARRAGFAWMVAIVPRLIGATVYHGGPPSEKVWASSSLALPADAPAQWRDIVSAESIEAAPGNLLALSSVFRHFPVSLLYHQERADDSTTVEESTHATTIQHIV
jgi:(1->4)-alpha-D-glucan 1-alpha-D-glucosylmutase